MYYKGVIDKNGGGLIATVDVKKSTKETIYEEKSRSLFADLFTDLPFVKDYKVGDNVDLYVPFSIDGASGYRIYHLRVHKITVDNENDETIIHFEFID